MKTFKIVFATLLFVLSFLSSCTKSDESQTPYVESKELKFTSATSKNQNSTVLYSDWIASGFPNSSLSGAEFFDIPLIKKEYFDSDKDLLIVYGKRNSVMQLPVTIPTSSESYMVELAPSTNGTIPRLRVTSLHWATEALQDIFFRPEKKAKFRVVIISGNKLIGLKSSNRPKFQKMTYEEITSYFEIPK